MSRRIEDIAELNARTLTVNFTAEASASVPTTVHWRLKCLSSDRVLQDWTALTTSSVTDPSTAVVECSATIAVSALLHAMQTNLNREQKALIVSADKGLSTEYNQEFTYWVERLNART